MPQNPTKPINIYLIYMYKEDLALNNQQKLMCHKSNHPTFKIQSQRNEKYKWIKHYNQS